MSTERLLQVFLKKGLWKKNYDRKNVSDVGCYSMNFGIVKHRSKGYVGGVNNEKHPEVYSLLKHLAEELKIQCTSFTINKNLKCKMHYDSANVGESSIIGIGDYKGGELIVESSTIDIRGKVFKFNGSKQLHGTADFTGDRYTVVFYTLKKK